MIGARDSTENFPAADGSVKVTVYLATGTLNDLSGLAAYLAAELNRAKAHSMADTRGLDRRTAAARRARWELQKEQLRRSGQLFDSRRALVTAGLAHVITDRGWDRQDLPPVPGQFRGRWVGSVNIGFSEQISVDLPADLVNRARAGCYHYSRLATDALHKWHERNPRATPTRPNRPGCDPEEYAEYTRLTDLVLTPGAIWRDAVKTGIIMAQALSST
ncbi:hypothetical protein OG949_40545 (plasmid) [Streptomyces scopuliridis]|uniref:hypothetical protein n=1 Tax=Streptomyces scopuliridis TaxID=452529 RepID=UPI002DD93E7C|nr:hypothetical protein [Streptomyces scopuliridis]WSB39048.1 hypothetical protein OG949_40545 [Streptomyces scopuliridis]